MNFIKMVEREIYDWQMMKLLGFPVLKGQNMEESP